MMKFSNVSVAAAVLLFGLFILYFVLPKTMLELFSLESNASAEFVARRASVLFLALSIIAISARNAKKSDARQAICLGGFVGMFLMATLGLVEFVRGASGGGTLFPVVIEFGFGVAFARIWLLNRSVR